MKTVSIEMNRDELAYVQSALENEQVLLTRLRDANYHNRENYNFLSRERALVVALRIRIYEALCRVLS